METIKTKGLIIRASDFGEANRMVKIFTTDLGIISAGVYGAYSKKKGMGASSRIFSWCDVILSKNSERLRVEETNIIEGFFPLGEDIVRLSTAVYFADLAQGALGEYNPDENVLRLLLNTLYAMCYNELDTSVAKFVFEMRLACETGYMPNLCDKYFTEKISKKACDILQYIISANDKRIFAFEIDDNSKTELAKICEDYILSQLGMNFKSLEYLKKIV